MDQSDLIISLRWYISLLRQEQERLNGVISSTIATKPQRIDSEINLRLISEKLLNAQRELRRWTGTRIGPNDPKCHRSLIASGTS
jgi:hypothetical protein